MNEKDIWKKILSHSHTCWSPPPTGTPIANPTAAESSMKVCIEISIVHQQLSYTLKTYYINDSTKYVTVILYYCSLHSQAKSATLTLSMDVCLIYYIILLALMNSQFLSLVVIIYLCNSPTPDHSEFALKLVSKWCFNRSKAITTTRTASVPFLLRYNWVSSVMEAVENIARPMPSTIFSKKLNDMNSGGVNIFDTNL